MLKNGQLKMRLNMVKFGTISRLQRSCKSTWVWFLPLIMCVVLVFSPATVLSDEQLDLAQIMSNDDTRHLLARTGIGVAPSEVLKYRKLTRQQAIDTLLAEFATDPSIPLPEWVNQAVPHYHARQDMDDSGRAMFNKERNAELSQLRAWWVLEMLQTPSPQTERMVLFWHDVFATDYKGINLQSLKMARQNQTFRRLGMGSWQTLLKAMIRDPALLQYLNAGSNHKNSPNENLARELLELFTLGVGNYGETTVKEAARTLTGNNTSQLHNQRFHFQSWKHDQTSKNLFGVTGDHRGDDLVNLILAQPAASRFLAERFWHAFISDTRPDGHWIESVSDVFRTSGFEIASLYRAMLESDAFWHERYRGALIKSPVDIITGTARSLEYPKKQWRKFAGWQRTLGMDLFAPPNVSGWNEGGAFITPGHLLNRYKLVDTLIKSDAASKQLAELDDSNTMSMNSNMSEPAKTDLAMAGAQMMPSEKQLNESKQLAIKLAAENYQGAVEYQVSVYAGDNILWRSDQLMFRHGQNTEHGGRIDEVSDLAWVTVPMEAPESSMSRATHVNVAYLNDAAGPGGDRNLFVDGVRVGKQWFDSSGAVQTSECPPELSADAGNLYCTGFVRFNLAIDNKVDNESLPRWRASAVHVAYANDNVYADRQNVTLTLDNVSTSGLDFHTLQLAILTGPDNDVRLRLETFGCWPACFTVWPDCAWQDPLFPQSKRLTFSKKISSDVFWQSKQPSACHFTSLKDQDKQLVNVLWHSVEHLLSEAMKTERAQRFTPVLEKVRAKLQANEVVLQDTPYAGDLPVLLVDKAYAPPKFVTPSLAGPIPQVASEEQLQALLQSAELPVYQLLMPFDNEQYESLSAVEQWVANPDFQLK